MALPLSREATMAISYLGRPSLVFPYQGVFHSWESPVQGPPSLVQFYCPVLLDLPVLLSSSGEAPPHRAFPFCLAFWARPFLPGFLGQDFPAWLPGPGLSCLAPGPGLSCLASWAQDFPPDNFRTSWLTMSRFLPPRVGNSYALDMQGLSMPEGKTHFRVSSS